MHRRVTMLAMVRLFRRLVRIGCIALLVVAGLVAYWIAGEVRAAKLPITSSFHPFRSPELRDEFLGQYERLAKRWPVPSETRTIETAFGPTFVRVSGLPDAPPLVLLHGIGGNAFQWLDNVEALSEHFRVFAVDNIYDNGRSIYTRPIERPEDYLLWMDELLGRIEKRKPIHLAGMSYGGWLATRYSLMRPDRLRSLVLIAPVATIRPLAPEWMMRAALTMIPLKATTVSFMTWLAEDLASSEQGRQRISQLADEARLSVRAFKPRSLVRPTVLSDEQLASLEPRTLLLVGENEKIYEASEVLERVAEIAPQIRSVLIPGAGHDLSIVQADRVNVEMIAFLLESEPEIPESATVDPDSTQPDPG